MAHGDITKAVMLPFSGINPKASYSYFFATSLPSYMNGVASSKYVKSGSSYTAYKWASADFVSVEAKTKTPALAAFAAIKLFAATTFSAGTSQSADIVFVGINKKVFDTAGLGSGLVDQSQKMTVAASATAEKKAVGQRS